MFEASSWSEAMHTWGTTCDERNLIFPCDRVLAEHNAAYFRGVTISAPPAIAFCWLCQLRVAPYSYDWIDNCGRRSPRILDAGLQNLAVGQPVMGIFDLVEYERDRHLTLRLRQPGMFPPTAVTYLIVPLAADRCRLLVKLVLTFRPTLLDRLSRTLLPSLDWVMMRRQLLNLKALAEATFSSAKRMRG